MDDRKWFLLYFLISLLLQCSPSLQGPESTTDSWWQPQTSPWWWWNTDRPEYTTENRWQPQTTPWWWWNTDRPTADGPDYTTWMWGTPNLPVVGEENVTLAVGVTQTISSHNYPSNYPNKVRYNWYITAPPGYDVIVDFLDFKLESCCDFLRIGIGESPSSPGSVTLATLTGSSLPSDMRLYSSPSWMMFNTDSSVTYRGFQLRLSLTNENTGITLIFTINFNINEKMKACRTECSPPAQSWIRKHMIPCFLHGNGNMLIVTKCVGTVTLSRSDLNVESVKFCHIH
ncbi:deleted in malignant brain tumors 1 protein-like [Lytechinus variegatus]|uniref:deleted in malignant brain tumors 1 protein-like n=1 Tax=Lytechinus variegatus TaxID=7654 RepID=UPI001BB157BF|nr:deleted in malignant brain tumors 1 protein-like [Lytechinus variegatus]